MRKRCHLLLFLGFITTISFAQPGDLMVTGVSPELHLVHTVAPKENWYSVGRLYNISPKEIAPANGLTMETPLSIGQQIKVPLVTSNFSQNGSKGDDEVYVPVYHIVQDKEWMFRISTNYNKVPVENLEKWNNINRDQAKAGTKLIIGYLKVKADLSSLATKGMSTVKTTSPPVKTTPAPNPQVPTTTNPEIPASVATQPEKAPEPIVKQENKVENTTPPADDKVVASNPPALPAANPATPVTTAVGAGYFETQFQASGKSVSGSAGIFKSTSGWQDGKYYALMNNVAVGTIVRVSNPTNKKAVFAKVLGQLPEMKESVGLTARVSDAAASELGITDARFSVEVKY